MSDTPRTDALGTNGYLETAVALCRRLERELQEKEAYAVSLRKFIEALPCPDPRCSDGSIISTGPDPQNDACEWCYMRHMLLNESQSGHEIGTGSNDQRRPAAIQQGGNGVLLSDSSGPRGSDAKSEAPSEGVSGATNPGHAVGQRRPWESVLIGGNHLATVLIGHCGPDFSTEYPPTMPAAEVLERMGYCDAYEVWCCWAAIMRARDGCHSQYSAPPDVENAMERLMRSHARTWLNGGLHGYVAGDVSAGDVGVVLRYVDGLRRSHAQSTTQQEK